MTSLISPATYAAAQIVTETDLNLIRDVNQQLQGRAPTGGQGALDFFSAVQATAQTGLASGALVSITFDTTSEIIDSAAGHSTTVNNSRYIGKTPGYYELTGSVGFAGSASGARRMAQFAFNGTAVAGSEAGFFTGGNAGACAANACTSYVYMNGTTDYVELQGYADYASWATVISGGVASRFNVRWIHV